MQISKASKHVKMRSFFENL